MYTLYSILACLLGIFFHCLMAVRGSLQLSIGLRLKRFLAYASLERLERSQANSIEAIIELWRTQKESELYYNVYMCVCMFCTSICSL